MELFRGTMVRHHAVAYAGDSVPGAVTFEGDAWLRFIPVRMPDTVVVRENLPPGCVAVILNRNHTYNDLYLPIDEQQARLLQRIDGKRTVEDIAESDDLLIVGSFFKSLWDWDQVIFCR